MQGPERPDIANAGSGETRYSECRVQTRYSECWFEETRYRSGRPDIVNAGSG
ncbi:unnamed protein product, partial [Staurois parvus]